VVLHREPETAQTRGRPIYYGNARRVFGLGGRRILVEAEVGAALERSADRPIFLRAIVDLLRDRPFEHAVDLLIDGLDGLLVFVRRCTGRIRSALRMLSRCSGGMRGAGRAICLALGARYLRRQLAYLGLQVIELCLDGLQVGAARREGDAERGRAHHESPASVLNHGITPAFYLLVVQCTFVR
jgi:hypothetical protein